MAKEYRAFLSTWFTIPSTRSVLRERTAEACIPLTVSSAPVYASTLTSPQWPPVPIL